MESTCRNELHQYASFSGKINHRFMTSPSRKVLSNDLKHHMLNISVVCGKAPLKRLNDTYVR